MCLCAGLRYVQALSGECAQPNSVGTLSKQKIKLVRSSGAQRSQPLSLPPARLDIAAEWIALADKFLATLLPATGAQAGAVRLLMPDGQTLQLLSAQGLPAQVQRAEMNVAADCGVCGKAAHGAPIDAADTGVCEQRCDGSTYFASNCGQVLAAPLLRDGQDTPFGVLTLFYASAAEQPAASSAAIASYAHLLAVALDNAMTHAELQRKAVQTERQSIANEIHDALAQTLYFAKMRSSLLQDAMRTENQLLAYKCARDIDEALESSQKTVRELVTHFRCQMDPQGLQFALQKLASEFGERSNIVLEYVNRIATLALPPEHELQTLLIVREALVNVSTHSGASAARLTVEFDHGRYVFTVEDNGTGCGSTPAEGHYGLTIMRERALRMGGEVQIENLRGAGTRVRLSFAAPAPRMELEE